MAIIKGEGAPTRKTTGAIGDIYIDTNTKKRYKCVFAYRSDDYSDFDCDWKEVKTDKIQTSSLYEEIKNESVEEVKEEPKDEPEVEVKADIPVKESISPVNQEAPKRTDYSAFGKKNR